MDKIDEKFSTNIEDIRKEIKKEHINKNTIEKKLQGLEDIFNVVNNYVIAEHDNYEDLMKEVEEL